MTPFEMLSRFQSKWPATVQEMKNSDHNYSSKELNPYHCEGDVWTHTLMVFNYAVQNNFPQEVQMAALLHDVGKPSCREVKEKNGLKHYVSFNSHEGASFYRALSILDSYRDVFDQHQIDHIAKMVANHSTLYGWQDNALKSKSDWVKTAFAGDSYFLGQLAMLVESDSLGRISEFPTDKYDYREYRDYTTHQEPIHKDEPTMMVLIGPPGCGKSSFSSNFPDHVVISSDNIIESLSGKDYNEKWKKADMKEVEKQMMFEFQKAVHEKKNIIIDRTNMSKKSRRRFVSNAKGYFKKAVVFNTPRTVIIARNIQRSATGKTISSDVIDRFEKAFTYPLLDEFHEVISVS